MCFQETASNQVGDVTANRNDVIVIVDTLKDCINSRHRVVSDRVWWLVPPA